MPYDLSDNSGADKPIDGPLSTAPTGPRPSDVLRGKGPSQQATTSVASLPFPLSARPFLPVDSAVNGLFWLSLIVWLAGICYLLYGVWTGYLADPSYRQHYSHADHMRILSNLTNVEMATRIAAYLCIASVMFLYYDLPTSGYALVVVALFLNFAIPWLSSFFLGLSKSNPSEATNLAVGFIAGLAPPIGVPGFILVVIDVIRRGLDGLREQKVKRSSLKYGQHIVTHAKRRNVFLGNCWNMPYCRDALRSKCPIFLQGKGPCWRRKEGCMCENSIAILATTAGNWKAAVANAMTDLEPKDTRPDFSKPINEPARNPLLSFAGDPAKSKLSWKEKEQRCRECVIYNTHQEQKYKALVWAIFGLAAFLMVFANGPLVGGIAALVTNANLALGSFSFAAHAGTAASLSNSATIGASWFLLSVFMLLVISKLLQLVEYFCFELKI